MSWPYIVPAVAAAWVVLGVLVALAWSAIKTIYRAATADDEATTLEMELAANWRVLRACDCIADELDHWVNQLLDEGSEACDVIIACRVVTDLRDRVAAL